MRAIPFLAALVFVSVLAEAQPTAASGSPDDRLNVVATLPDLADLVTAIGGEHVEVKTLARPGQNLHAVRVKPSHLVAVSRADLFVQVGLSLEHAWVPGLLETGRNRSVLPGQPGFVSAGKGYKMIEVPVRMDRALSADVHPQGNPHINLSLGGGVHMAKRIRDGLVRVDPEHAADYRAGFQSWNRDYETARKRWDIIAKAVSSKNAEACLYHQEFDYLLGEMGLGLASFLEPRPGLAPTPSHLAKVVQTIRSKRIPVVLTAPWSNNKNVARIAKMTGCGILELPVMVGGRPEHGTWISMIDDSVRRLAKAYGVDPDEAVRRSLTKVAPGAPVVSGAGG